VAGAYAHDVIKTMTIETASASEACGYAFIPGTLPSIEAAGKTREPGPVIHEDYNPSAQKLEAPVTFKAIA